MRQAILIAASVTLAAAIAYGAGHVVRLVALRKSVLAAVEARSSHAAPTPVGGGIAVMVAVSLLWLAFALPGERYHVASLLLLSVILAAVSWWDDVSRVNPWLRLLLQGGAVAGGLVLLPDTLLVFQGLLPMWIDRLIAGLAWLWFVNLYNFMDGIDGLAAVQTVAISLGLAFAAVIAGSTLDILYPLVIAGAALGFCALNWHPARLFLGDVGSIPLGYLLGFMLLVLAGEGHFAAAALLPAYYLLDSTVTLARRALEGRAVWRAHREHYYQRGAVAYGRHDAVTIRIAALNALLLILAMLTLGASLAVQFALATLGYLAALVLALHFARMAPERRSFR